MDKEILVKCGFTLDENGTYFGQGRNMNELCILSFEDKFLSCKAKNGRVEEIIFVVDENISVGALLVLLQDYNIINERYIYENVDYIAETFFGEEL